MSRKEPAYFAALPPPQRYSPVKNITTLSRAVCRIRPLYLQPDIYSNQKSWVSISEGSSIAYEVDNAFLTSLSEPCSVDTDDNAYEPEHKATAIQEFQETYYRHLKKWKEYSWVTV